MEYDKNICPVVDVDGVIASGKQFDLDITLPQDNRNVIYGIIRNCYKEPVRDAVVKLIEVVRNCAKEERKPVSHTFTDKNGEFVFGPLCPDKYYEIQIWVDHVKHAKICATCDHEGSCLKGVDIDCKKPHKPCECNHCKKDYKDYDYKSSYEKDCKDHKDCDFKSCEKKCEEHKDCECKPCEEDCKDHKDFECKPCEKKSEDNKHCEYKSCEKNFEEQKDCDCKPYEKNFEEQKDCDCKPYEKKCEEQKNCDCKPDEKKCEEHKDCDFRPYPGRPFGYRR